MICIAFNKMSRFVDYVFNEHSSDRNEVQLWEIVLMSIIFLITLFILSWWVLPIRFIFKKYGSITFYHEDKKSD